jgi:hydrogenase maturation protease
VKTTLLLGYGNIDRQDDGVAWHILRRVAQRLGRSLPEFPDEEFIPGTQPPDYLFTLQLSPELTETLIAYQRVCFVDAHTGNVPEDVHHEPVVSQFQASPLTHHMTAASCIALCDAIFNRHPEAVLYSVRGYEFGFEHSLSASTYEHAQLAAEQILNWLDQGDNEDDDEE